MQALVFKRLPLNMPEDKAEQIATKLAEENFHECSGEESSGPKECMFCDEE